MIKSERSREGYLLIDNRGGPGVPEEMILKSGLDAPFVPEGKVYESAIRICGHCSVTVVLNPNRTRARNSCTKCDSYICDVCSNILNKTLECQSQKKKFELLQETEARKLNIGEF